MSRLSRAYAVRFTVEGFGTFPLDMLRYDACYPATSQDVAMIENKRERRAVTLIHCGTSPWEPTHGRWQSFLWNVTTTEVL